MPQINTIKNLKQSNQYFKVLEQEKSIERKLIATREKRKKLAFKLQGYKVMS